MLSEYFILLTDIVDSTHISERLGDEVAARLWDSHDRVARDLLREWRGREIDKTDGFLLLFENGADAVGYAVALHDALRHASPPIATRVGLHRGVLMLRTNTARDVALGAKPLEVEGINKAVAARIMALCQGGQTLLSVQARSALTQGPWQVRSHGHWRLKGVTEPIELFEVGDAAAPFTPPPDVAKAYRVVRAGDEWMPARAIANNLPMERDGFVGRREALLDITRRFDQGARLVSLVGTGGIGKTRLAVRYARAWLGGYPGGAWFCDLSSSTSVDGIAHAVAYALDVPLGSTDPVQQLGTAIAGRDACLVILDNFEQVSRYANATLGVWLDRATNATFLVTSREMLGLAGEQSLIMPTLSANEAVQLFRSRAVATGIPAPAVADDESSIVGLVELLDRLPLAIELAAARAPVMPPRELLHRMGDRFKLLSTTSGRPDRQATLRATLDWSWDLLSKVEQATLAQLSVFEGGFTLAAAEHIVDPAGDESCPWIVDLFQSLVQKSLVSSRGDARFDLLRSVQEYAADRLASLPDNDARISACRLRHIAYFATFENAAVAECLREIENLVIACRRATAVGDARSAVACLIGAWQALKMTGPFQAALELVQTLERIPDVRPLDRLKLAWAAGRVQHLLGNQDAARRQLDHALRESGLADDCMWNARVLCASGDQLITMGLGVEAKAQLDRALEAARDAANDTVKREVLNSLGALAVAQGDPAAARRIYEEALALCPATGGDDARGGLLGNLGEVCLSVGEIVEARRFFEGALALVSSAGHRRWEGNIRCNLGLLLIEQGEAALGQEQLASAIHIAREIGYTQLEATALCNLGILKLSLGAPVEALSCHQRAVSLATGLGAPRTEGQFRTYLGQVLTDLGRLDDAAECLARGEMLLRSTNDSISLALLLCAHARLLSARGRSNEALRAFGEAQSLAQRAQTHPASELGGMLACVARFLEITDERRHVERG